MKAKYDEFLKYKFRSNPEFQSYIDGLYPAPDMLNLESYKKRFYRKYIDHEFDIHYGEPEIPAPSQRPASAPVSWIDKIQMIFLGVFLAVMPLGIITQTYYHMIVIGIAIILGLLKENGFIKFTKEYFKQTLSSDYLNDLMILGLCAFSFNGSVIMWVPLILMSVVKISEFVHNLAAKGNNLAKLINGVFDYAFIRKDYLEELKSDIEVYTGFYLLAMIAFGWISFMQPMIYWQIMQVRYIINKKINKAINELAARMDSIIAMPNLPKILKYPFIGLRKFGAYMATIGKQSEEPAPAQTTTQAAGQTSDQAPAQTSTQAPTQATEQQPEVKKQEEPTKTQ
jgi:hypothetical protein